MRDSEQKDREVGRTHPHLKNLCCVSPLDMTKDGMLGDVS